MAYCHRTSHHLPICQVAAFPKAIGAGLKANTQVLTINTSMESTILSHLTPQQCAPFLHCMTGRSGRQRHGLIDSSSRCLMPAQPRSVAIVQETASSGRIPCLAAAPR